MISLCNICHGYKTKDGYHTVLNDVNIEFERGHSTAILGLNGAGKSTLIRIIGGAEQPHSGKVIRTSSVSWPIGFSGCFNGSLTGRENLRFVCRIYGADIRKVSEFVEDFSELGEYMDMPFKTYSSGMRSKLAFGLSLAVGFDFYLVDEAFSVGDVVFRQKAAKALQHLKSQSSLIYVSHSINSVKEHCDRGAVLNNGILHSYDNLADAINEYTRICHDRSNKAAA